MNDQFTVKDSGKRQEFASGMVRDTQEGKAEYHRIYDGPLVDRFAAHLTKGAIKYPDNADGTPNWTNANSQEEMQRFRKSAARHFRQWMRNEQDEDHFAAVTFNMNCYEFVKERMQCQSASTNAPSVTHALNASNLPQTPWPPNVLEERNTKLIRAKCSDPYPERPSR